jgi:hypothetical protein
LLQLEKHNPETKNCILIAATKVTPPGDPKKTASLLLQTQETPPGDKKNCILVAANSRNTTQRPKKKLHPCCCKLMKHHPETYRKLLKVVHVNNKFYAPLERETLKNIAK